MCQGYTSPRGTDQVLRKKEKQRFATRYRVEMSILQDKIDASNEEYDKTNARRRSKVNEVKKFAAKSHDFGMPERDIADWNARKGYSRLECTS